MNLSVFFLVLVFGVTAPFFTLAHAEETAGVINIEMKESVNLSPVSSEGASRLAEMTLSQVKGVKKSMVDYSRRTVHVLFDSDQVDIDHLMTSLRAVGFIATPAQAQYICPICQGTYQSAGACLLCELELEPAS